MKDVLIIALCIPAGAAFGWRMANEIERWTPKAVWPLAIFMIVGLVAIVTARVPDGWPATVAIGAGWIAGVAIVDYRRRRHAALEAELRSIAAEGGIRDEDGNPIDPAKVHVMPRHMERQLLQTRSDGEDRSKASMAVYDEDPEFVEVRRLSDAADLPRVAALQLAHLAIGKPWTHGPDGWVVADVVWAPNAEPAGGALHWIVIGVKGERFVFRTYMGDDVWCDSFTDALSGASRRLREEVAGGLRS